MTTQYVHPKLPDVVLTTGVGPATSGDDRMFIEIGWHLGSPHGTNLKRFSRDQAAILGHALVSLSYGDGPMNGWLEE